MFTHDALIDKLGGPHKLAASMTAIGIPVREVTARAWAMRKNIPARYWPHVKRVAAEAGETITLDQLAESIVATPGVPA